MFVFVSGAVRSGKSEWAERKAMELSPASPRVYLATAQVTDPEMRRRVERHQKSRADRGFITLERERGLEALVSAILPDATILLECLATWTANEMFGGGERTEDDVVPEILRAVGALRARSENLILVSNDIFSDGVSYDPATEAYLRAMGTLHAALAPQAELAVECAYGLVRVVQKALGLRLKPYQGSKLP